MKNLTESGEIQVEDCKPDSTDNSIAYCPVWVWYFPQWLPVTDVMVVGVVGTKSGQGTLRPSPKLERILAKLTEASQKLSHLSDEGKAEHLVKMEQIFSSNAETPQQPSDLSDRGKEGMTADELDNIFSAMLAASQDVTDKVDRPSASQEFDHIFTTLFSGSHHLLDDTGRQISHELKKKVSEALSTTVQKIPGISKVDDIMTQSALKLLTNPVYMNMLDSLLEHPEILQILLQNFNLHSIENILQDSNVLELLIQSLLSSDNAAHFGKWLISKSVVAHFGKIGVDKSVDQFDFIHSLLQGLDENNIRELLVGSGFIEIIVQHIETYYLDETENRPDFEKALIQNLKENQYFEETLRSGITDALVEHLNRYNNQNSVGKILNSGNFINKFKNIDTIKSFLQKLKPEDVDNLISKSGILERLPTHFETNYVETFHDNSDFDHALVNNIKSNPYVDESVKTDLLKHLMPNSDNK